MLFDSNFVLPGTLFKMLGSERELWGTGLAGAVKDRRCMIGMLNYRLRRRSAPNQEYPDDGVRVVVAPWVPCLSLGMIHSPLSGGNDFATQS